MEGGKRLDKRDRKLREYPEKGADASILVVKQSLPSVEEWAEEGERLRD